MIVRCLRAIDLEAKRAEMEAELAGMEMSINDHNTMYYQYYPGWPIRLEMVRSIQMKSPENTGGQEKRMIIEQIQ